MVGYKGTSVSIASTGPHSEECGEGEVARSLERCGVASTGPHSEECGELADRFRAFVEKFASTGPHSEECGETQAVRAWHLWKIELQRGRTPKSAESEQYRKLRALDR